MVKVDETDAELLSKAVIVWTGYESSKYPTRSDDALTENFSVQMASKLLPIVKSLEDDFYKSEAHITAASLSEMKEAAASEFRRKHPDLPSIIADAFAWCYTFDYK